VEKEASRAIHSSLVTRARANALFLFSVLPSILLLARIPPLF
jgi:hypothetical protein